MGNSNCYHSVWEEKNHRQFHCRWGVPHSSGYSQPVQISGFCPASAVNAGTVLELGEFLLGGFFVAVDLPAAAAFAQVRPQTDKTVDIFRRIPQEQTDLMGKILCLPQLLDQTSHTFFAVSNFITMAEKQSLRFVLRKIPLQFPGAEEIQKCLLPGKAEREQ